MILKYFPHWLIVFSWKCPLEHKFLIWQNANFVIYVHIFGIISKKSYLDKFRIVRFYCICSSKRFVLTFRFRSLIYLEWISEWYEIWVQLSFLAYVYPPICLFGYHSTICWRISFALNSLGNYHKSVDHELNCIWGFSILSPWFICLFLCNCHLDVISLALK